MFSAALKLSAQDYFVTTYAGSRDAGFVDGDALTQAKFQFPAGAGACVGPDGSVYVADQGNHAIRKITKNGMVSTIAGNGTPGFVDGDGLIHARFNAPTGIEIDHAGHLYVADRNNQAIRKITPGGLVTTLAGTGQAGNTDGPGNAATFVFPVDVAVDAGGNVYVAALGNNIRKIAPDGMVRTYAGSTGGYMDGPANIAQFYQPAGVDIDEAGNVYVAEEGNHRIRKISTDLMVSTIAGSGPSVTGAGVGSFADGNALTEARFNTPNGLVIDNNGDIYVADRCNHRIRKISGDVVTTVAGSGATGCGQGGFNDGPGISAIFHEPGSVCHDENGTLFVADLINNLIRKIQLLTQTVNISGTVYVDKDTSCNLTAGDIGIGNRMIEFEHPTGRYYVFTSNAGIYQFTGPPGSYNVRLVNTLISTESCGNTVYARTLQSGQQSTNNNFFIIDVCALNLIITTTFPYPLIDPCPGLPLNVCATIINTGTIDLDPVPLFTPATPFTITPKLNISFSTSVSSSTCALTSPVAFVNGTSLEWTITNNIPAGGSCEICIDATIAFVSVMSIVIYEVETPNFHCVNTFENIHRLKSGSHQILCSVDPNAKLLVFPDGCGELGKIKKDEELFYKIHFQNIGNAPARNVVIIDTLDNDLDIFSLFLLPTSHPVTKFEVLPGNILKWTFIDIQLPDSISNPEGSRGFIQFQINHLADLADGTEIINRAAIIFDLNEPLITNSTVNTIFDTVGPSLSFSFNRQCGADVYDFSYTGSAGIASVLWNFGEDAIPSKSNLLNPSGIKFLSPGKKEILLFAEDLEGCSAFITDTIEIEDISCGKNKDKVVVCHATQAKQPKHITLCIDSNDVVNHVNHGDCIGTCMPAASKAQNNESELYPDTSITSDKVIIYVNPYDYSITTTLMFPYKGALKISIADITGREIYTSYNIVQNEQPHSFIVPTNSSLSTGMYFCKVTLNNAVYIKKLICVK